MLSGQFLTAVIVYGIAILIVLPLSVRIHARLKLHVLQWQWDHIAMPLLYVLLLILFIAMAYPLLFGIENAPSLGKLLGSGEIRMNKLVNLVFIISLLFPVIPVLGEWRELILPLQGIAATMMIFSWLTYDLGVKNVHYWPGLTNTALILAVAVLTHWLAIRLAGFIGHRFDTRFNVLDSGELFARCLILFMQSPAVLIFSTGLGKQLL